MISCSFFLLTKFLLSYKKAPSFHFCLLVHLVQPCLFKVCVYNSLFSTLLSSHFIPKIYLGKYVFWFPKPTVPAFTANPNKISGPLAGLISYSCLKNLVTFGTTDCVSFWNNHISWLFFLISPLSSLRFLADSFTLSDFQIARSQGLTWMRTVAIDSPFIDLMTFFLFMSQSP